MAQPKQVAKKYGKKMVMAKSKEDTMLEHLSEDVDNALFKWLSTYEVPGLNLTAIILARLTWLAKQGGYEDDFFEILKAPEDIVNRDNEEKVMH
jgi:translation elongation factor EF-Tu-like GTPase